MTTTRLAEYLTLLALVLCGLTVGCRPAPSLESIPTFLAPPSSTPFPYTPRPTNPPIQPTPSATRLPTLSPVTLVPTTLPTVTALPSAVPTIAATPTLTPTIESQTIATSRGELNVPGIAFLDGREEGADPPYTTMVIDVLGAFPQEQAVCALVHGDEVSLLEVIYVDAEEQYYFKVQRGECEGWLSELYISPAYFEPVGEQIYP